VAKITLTQATLSFHAKREAGVPSAIVINGIGVAEAGFDKTTGTAGRRKLEHWGRDDHGNSRTSWLRFRMRILPSTWI